jgi:predicted ATP-grasp superfamily ATP-dependent carboligase
MPPQLAHDGLKAGAQYARALPAWRNVPTLPEKQEVLGAVQPRLSPTVLLLGNYRPALTVARSLSRHGYSIMMGVGGGEGCGEYSRFVDESWDHPALSGTGDEFLASLLTLLEAKPEIEVIYPVAEEFVRFLAERERALPERLIVASPRSDIVRTCCDKLALLGVVERVGVDHLPFRVISALNELAPAANEIGFPVAIRPINNLIRLGHKKALIASDAAELGHLLPHWPDGHERLLLQRYAKGERQDVFFAALNGRILRAAQVRYLRTDHIDGTGLCVYGELQALDKRLLKSCQALTQELNYTGIGCAQFVVDPVSSDICFIELNPRTSAIHAAPEAVGMELSYLAIALAQGAVLPEFQETFGYKAGRRYAWTYGELRGIRSALRNREIGPAQATRWVLQMLWSALSADLHLTWRRTDPLPTIMLFLRMLNLSGKSPKSTHFRQGFIRPAARG